MKKYIITFIIIAVSFLTYCFFPVIIYSPDYENEPWYIYISDRNWIVITDKAKPNGYKKIINLDLKSKFVKDLLKIEDRDYYNHFWIDIISKIWAIKTNISNNKIISGWSTITEQYIKNKYFKWYKRTYLQKSREALISIYFSLFQGEYPKGEGLEIKDLILTNYLNNIYFWNNLYWVWAAIEVYFDKDNLEELNQEEITLLISLIHNPWIKSLEEESFRKYFEKVKNKLGYNFERTIFKLNKKVNLDKFPHVTNNPSLNSLPLKKEGGYKVSIDSKLQQFSKDILNKTLDELKDKNVTNWAIFAIIPSTREILIYQWSRDFNSSEIDGQVDVIQSLRQPWSTMKPFLYLMALENWANPDDLVLDLENQYNSFVKWKTYISNNYSLKEFWLVRFKKALWNSLNNATVRLAKELWLNNVYDFYKKYRFNLAEDSEHYWYSLVLWNPSIKLEDLVRSYSKLVPNSNPSPRTSVLPLKREEIIVNQSKFLLYDILSDPDNRDLSFWVNSILNTSIPQAVKTWTSSDFRDNLIVSYHPDLVLWIWIGNNNNSSMIWVTGITWAWYIWHNIIEKAIEIGYIKDREIKVPEWIVETEYCLDEKCYRKELIYKKEGKKYFSRLADWKYSKKDIFEDLNLDEIERLKGFEIYLNK